MTLLLDTHAFLWFIWADPKLSDTARQLIEDSSNRCLLSVASLWEISVKVTLGKLSVTLPLEALVEEHVHGNAIELVPISMKHLDELVRLPLHHRDPFDRLIIAQARCEQATLISRDSAFGDYEITWRW